MKHFNNNNKKKTKKNSEKQKQKQERWGKVGWVVERLFIPFLIE